MLFDTHCHLDFPEFDADIPQWLDKMEEKAIKQVCIPSVGPENWEKVLHLSKLYPEQVCCALGIHPCFPPKQANAIDKLKVLVYQQRPNICAIGEIGLDGRRNNDALQESLFEAQLMLAKEVELPVIVHCVKRHHRVLPMLKAASLDYSGVIHAFNGDYSAACHYIDLGYKLGVGATFMWPSATKLRDVLSKLPLESIVFETDAPDMPLPDHKKGTATPLDVVTIAKYFAELSDISTNKVIDGVYSTSCELFKRNK